jgi:hypothetical protein
VPWYSLTKVVLGIQTILTIMTLFFRTDFVNLTVCTTAIYMLSNTDKIKKWTFRGLVFGIFISLIYDLLWFFFQEQSNDLEDGGVQKSVRNFSLTISYLSFFFRVSIKPLPLYYIDNCGSCLLERLSRLQPNYKEANGLY